MCFYETPSLLRKSVPHWSFSHDSLHYHCLPIFFSIRCPSFIGCRKKFANMYVLSEGDFRVIGVQTIEDGNNAGSHIVLTIVVLSTIMSLWKIFQNKTFRIYYWDFYIENFFIFRPQIAEVQSKTYVCPVWWTDTVVQYIGVAAFVCGKRQPHVLAFNFCFHF